VDRFYDSPKGTLASVPPHSLGSAERGATNPPAHPKDGDGFNCRNVGKTSYPDAAVCLRKFN